MHQPATNIYNPAVNPKVTNQGAEKDLSLTTQDCETFCYDRVRQPEEVETASGYANKLRFDQPTQ